MTSTNTLTLDTANRMIEAGRASAAQLGVDMNLAILDGGAHLLQFSRMDDAWLGSIDLALKKARTSVMFRIPSADLGDITKPGDTAYGIDRSNGGLVSFGGGLPLKDADGRIIGAVGVSGGTVEEDVMVAQAMVKAYA
ncbi:heme-binding protein [Streptomyces sp. TRM66268-LWL]|uniref:Heme-binding protein n=1 Tax=Streptomyces polyasparticus TaxID=2767826 RepID=A0ABR7SRV4_9ACTN|nr:heme-binding protein [Streptomyces polyasparticus]MBC9717519.1 heme-binding protein [Streptomyces polyasparticus]